MNYDDAIFTLFSQECTFPRGSDFTRVYFTAFSCRNLFRFWQLILISKQFSAPKVGSLERHVVFLPRLVPDLIV